MRAWAARRPGEVGPFKVQNMVGSRFFDLKLRLGQPYVYVHQGDCEHILVVTDLRCPALPPSGRSLHSAALNSTIALLFLFPLSD